MSGTKRLSKNAVVNQPKNADGNSARKSTNSPLPAVHTISVVMSPNGLHAPPALAATTTLMPLGTRKALFLLSMVSKTVDKIKAVVRLSATGEMKNASRPVIQNNCG